MIYLARVQYIRTAPRFEKKVIGIMLAQCRSVLFSLSGPLMLGLIVGVSYVPALIVGVSYVPASDPASVTKNLSQLREGGHAGLPSSLADESFALSVPEVRQSHPLPQTCRRV